MSDIDFHYHHAHHYKIQHYSRKTLWLSLVLTFIFALVELAGGMISGSLALISDSFHMFSDVLALTLSMIAIYYSAKQPTDKFTYGYVRVEIIAAFLNGAALVFIALGVAFEGIRRLLHPTPVDFRSMLAVASIGLLINILLTLMLMNSLKHEKNLNIQSAFWHFFGDLLNSVGILVAALLIYWTGIIIIDAIASLVISIIIFWGGYKICRRAGIILMEAVPPELKTTAIHQSVLAIPNVKEIHEFHLWSIADGLYSLSFHVILERYRGVNDYELIKNISNMLKHKYHIEHVTIQIENPQVNAH
ncbi:cation transporter [Actinobacillus succinogenes]|uniref:Cation diffusion facilitator family transporter n=1 Tax=Actinobacillus succinogenes (strain ATCC 55618 / DSM 22257 / CCUG 43843 / 130Z) TaxID=339671 RepID=A6VLS9_ACTSZ|nr:cation diffusion facilitator family transporter [Actinobacillus succinogenes]ABR73926.1 cation diffusion facilitator family transporter [Actinobacillus succinogenes 130Z]PHI39626.1 cation transporter [Actinobacillus succinogenes]